MESPPDASKEQLEQHWSGMATGLVLKNEERLPAVQCNFQLTISDLGAEHRSPLNALSMAGEAHAPQPAAGVPALWR